MATFTLDSLRDEVAKKYEPTVITDGNEEFVIPNILQMPKKQRKQVLDLIETIENSEEDFSAQIEVFFSVLKVAVADSKGEKLIDLVGDDAALVTEIVTEWLERSQVGEAVRS